MTMAEQQFRIGQRVCCVGWRRGHPYLKFGTITRANTRGYYVDDCRRKACGWHEDGRQAIDAEYRSLFAEWGLIPLIPKPDDWTIKDTLRCVLRLRRMERRLFTRGQNRKRKGS
jgi:hypothetical protein